MPELAGIRYLAVWVDDDPGDMWLHAPTSSSRLARLKLGTVSPRSAFEHPEVGEAFLYLADAQGALRLAKTYRSGSIPEDYLPDQGATLASSRSKASA